jgi:hypothetical protein
MQQSQPQPPRKTAFDFVSPLDAFQQPPSAMNPNASLPKRKPVPSETSEGRPSSSGMPPNTTSPPRDATLGGEAAVGGQDGDTTKRKSIDLLEQLTRAAPLTHQTMAPVEQQTSMPPPMMNYTSPAQQPQQMSGGYRPQPQVPAMESMMPRDQSPALMGQTPPSTSPGFSMSGPITQNQMQATAQSRASPTAKGRAGPNPPKKDWKSKNGGNDFLKSRSPAGPQSFTLDLSLPLAATSASSDRLHITPIALLKLESIYVPGCTIGVSHWIAYAMTKGSFFSFDLCIQPT